MKNIHKFLIGFLAVLLILSSGAKVQAQESVELNIRVSKDFCLDQVSKSWNPIGCYSIEAQKLWSVLAIEAGKNSPNGFVSLFTNLVDSYVQEDYNGMLMTALEHGNDKLLDVLKGMNKANYKKELSEIGISLNLQKRIRDGDYPDSIRKLTQREQEIKTVLAGMEKDEKLEKVEDIFESLSDMDVKLQSKDEVNISRMILQMMSYALAPSYYSQTDPLSNGLLSVHASKGRFVVKNQPLSAAFLKKMVEDYKNYLTSSGYVSQYDAPLFFALSQSHVSYAEYQASLSSMESINKYLQKQQQKGKSWLDFADELAKNRATWEDAKKLYRYVSDQSKSFGETNKKLAEEKLNKLIAKEKAEKTKDRVVNIAVTMEPEGSSGYGEFTVTYYKNGIKKQLTEGGGIPEVVDLNKDGVQEVTLLNYPSDIEMDIAQAQIPSVYNVLRFDMKTEKMVSDISSFPNYYKQKVLPILESSLRKAPLDKIALRLVLQQEIKIAKIVIEHKLSKDSTLKARFDNLLTPGEGSDVSYLRIAAAANLVP